MCIEKHFFDEKQEIYLEWPYNDPCFMYVLLDYCIFIRYCKISVIGAIQFNIILQYPFGMVICIKRTAFYIRQPMDRD